MTELLERPDRRPFPLGLPAARPHPPLLVAPRAGRLGLPADRGRRDVTRPRWTLALTCLASFLVGLRRARRHDRAAGDRGRPAGRPRRPAGRRHRLPARLRGRDRPGLGPRRPRTAAAGSSLPGSRSSPPASAGCALAPGSRRAAGLASGAGAGRGGGDAAEPDDPHGGVPGGARGVRPRPLGRRGRPRGRLRTARRRRPHAHVAGWHAIFWLTVPVGAGLRGAVGRHGCPSRTAPRHRPDGTGLALLAGSVLALAWGLARAGSAAGADAAGTAPRSPREPSSPPRSPSGSAGPPAPLLPPRLLRAPGFAAAAGTAVLLTATINAATFFVAQFFQEAQGEPPLAAGLRLLPWTLTPLAVSPLAGALSDRVGRRPVLAAGMLAQGLGLGWFALAATPDAGYAALAGPCCWPASGSRRRCPPPRRPRSAPCGRRTSARRPAP